MGKSREQKDNTELCKPGELPVRYYSQFDMRIILGVVISVLILSTYYINSLEKVYEGSSIFKLATYRDTCVKGKEINITNTDSLRSVIQKKFGEENLSRAPLLSRVENFDWVNLNSGLIKVTILKNSIESVEKNLNIISDYFMEYNSSVFNQFKKQAQRNADLITYLRAYNSSNLKNLEKRLQENQFKKQAQRNDDLINYLKAYNSSNLKNLEKTLQENQLMTKNFELLPEGLFAISEAYLKFSKKKLLSKDKINSIVINVCNYFDIRNGQNLTGNVIKRADTWEKKSLFILVSVFIAFIFSNFLVLIIKFIREDKKFVTQDN